MNTAADEPFWKALRGEEIEERHRDDVLRRSEVESVTQYLAWLRGDFPDREAIRARAAARLIGHLQLIRDVARTLDRREIPWALLKGLALSYTIYGDPAARTAGDCDILVPADRRDEVSSLFTAAGFTRDPGHAELLTGRTGQIDLHVDFVNSDRVPARRAAIDDYSGWISRRAFVEIEDMLIPTLDPSLTAVHLTHHLVHHHGMIGARWLLDIHLLLRKCPNLANEVRQSSVHGPALIEMLGILLGSSTIDRPISLKGRLFTTANALGVHPAGTRFLLTATDIPNIRDRARFIRETLLPSARVLRQVHGYSAGRAIVRHLTGIAATGRDWFRIAAKTAAGRS